MKRISILLALTLFVTACAAPGTPAPTLVPTPTTPNMWVDAWVDNPAPALGTDVVVHFVLLNAGVPINGLAMSAEWQQGGYKRLCSAQVLYDMAQCVISVSEMEPGVYVPVTATTEYIGWTFYGYTGFTPQ